MSELDKVPKKLKIENPSTFLHDLIELASSKGFQLYRAYQNDPKVILIGDTHTGSRQI